ncbi:MAG: phosphatase PAP2 family protein [Dehalococcoidia bacterium]|nr:MAG: phosphatase PAP2 family protein [Dehalococcoidia bacterium]
MNSFDSSIISFLNDFAGHWKTFDELMVFMSDSSLVKAGPIMACLIWLWFRRETDGPSRRDYIVATIITGIVAVVIARLLASALPFRERPMADAAQRFVVPSGAGRDLESWSSFPSDHAVLFFALATGLYQAHKPFGIGAFAWAIVVVCFPRLYLGIHWPTDIIGGAALGVALGWLGTSRAVRDAVCERLMPWHDAQPAVFYTGLFIVMFEVMNLFEDGREALHLLHHAAGNIL